jgi:sucrose phosphorylase
VLFSFLAGNASKLSAWAMSLNKTTLSPETTYFNFLASHDGIGMRPVENILDEQEKRIMLQSVIKHGGRISYKQNSDGSKSPYELNINYMDALTDPSSPDIQERVDKFLAAQSILLSMVGVPGIYIHSLLGSQNWYEGVVQSGIFRRINREKLDYDNLCRELEDEGNTRNMVLGRFSKLINLRRQHSAFAPRSSQQTLFLDQRAFVIVRYAKDEQILAIINVSSEEYSLHLSYKGFDIIHEETIDGYIKMLPYQIRWIKL